MLENVNPVTIWILIGVLFAISELAIPGLVIIFFGAGALLTGATTYLSLTPDLHSQILFFAVTSVCMVIIAQTVLRNRKKDEDKMSFNLEIGKIVPVIEYIDSETDSGRVRYQGVSWHARSSQKIAPGESVRISGCDNLTLIVEPIETELTEGEK